jgi:hypothetical protein
MKNKFNDIASIYARRILNENAPYESSDEQDNTEGESIELDRDAAQKIFDALSAALGDETSEDAEGIVDATKDVLKKGTYAGGGALAGNYVGKVLGGSVGGLAGNVVGAGLGARAAR